MDVNKFSQNLRSDLSFWVKNLNEFVKVNMILKIEYLDYFPKSIFIIYVKLLQI